MCADPVPWFGVRIFEAVRQVVDPAVAAKVVLLAGHAYADSPCPEGLDEYIALEAIREERRPQHACLTPRDGPQRVDTARPALVFN